MDKFTFTNYDNIYKPRLLVLEAKINELKILNYRRRKSFK